MTLKQTNQKYSYHGLHSHTGGIDHPGLSRRPNEVGLADLLLQAVVSHGWHAHVPHHRPIEHHLLHALLLLQAHGPHLLLHAAHLAAHRGHDGAAYVGGHGVDGGHGDESGSPASKHGGHLRWRVIITTTLQGTITNHRVQAVVTAHAVHGRVRRHLSHAAAAWSHVSPDIDHAAAGPVHLGLVEGIDQIDVLLTSHDTAAAHGTAAHAAGRIAHHARSHHGAGCTHGLLTPHGVHGGAVGEAAVAVPRVPQQVVRQFVIQRGQEV